MKQTYSICLVLVCVMSVAGAAEKNIPAATIQANETRAINGKVALEKKDYKQARENFSAGVQAARAQGDVPTETRFLFYEGLANQSAGEAHGDETSLRNAISSYRQVLVRKPDSGSTMVNLAQVLGRLNEPDEAERLYRQAIQLNDSNRPAYQTAYAGFLDGQGRSEDARRLYMNLVQTDPFNQVARKALADYYTDASAEWGQLRSYLWGLVQRGEVDQSIELALEALAKRTPSEESDHGLLVIIAASLSRKIGLAESFLASPTAQDLRGFSERANISGGVVELLDIYRALAVFDATGKSSDRNDYMELSLSWWLEQRGEEGSTPRDVMRQLLSSLGDRYGQRKKYAVAELCFEKAIAISPYDPDPAAIRNLVNLYAEQGQGQKIDEIATRYEFNLFESKGRAYRDSDLEKIYQYHRTLGQIYGYLAEKSGNWGDRRTPKSAIFQLEHAMRVGRELDQMLARDTEKHLYHIDPGLVDLLATAYTATGSAASSTSLRLDAARQYERAGDERARDYVLKPIRSEDLTPDQTREYRSLMRSRGA